VRYALSPYIKQIHAVVKGLIIVKLNEMRSIKLAFTLCVTFCVIVSCLCIRVFKYSCSRSRWPRGLWSFACWDCGFECRRGHGCLSLVNVVCSGKGLFVGLITRPEDSYRVWCV
jgi:hypothetical protein